ncbi:probable cyclin-dependent serine/threonine-protein kinase DDB_G0292550 isoform X2 [Microplitis demolitor]|uniref:probable cyclin-dependent serine/threonine-protein kinase DDB_G0292550 isoform X2 n=1 Tax=Microplitis demolitor TaxID=69319 RepID=UPI00235B6889|nr:probable cyclin-dependent serine/threonine-protein kinase DDB_G0292550 isoform X2 [Microplitis demolitor]
MIIAVSNVISQHYTECESYASVQVQQLDLNDRKNYSGIISFEEVTDQLTKAFEAFGSTNNNVDRFHSIDGPGYDPIQTNINKPLYRSLDCESKSKKKQFRMIERQRHAASSAQGSNEWHHGTEQNDNHESLEHKPMSSKSTLMTNNDYQDENDEHNGNIDEDRIQFNVYSSDNGLTNENKNETSKDESTKKFENKSCSTGRFENLSDENNHGSLVDQMEFTLVSKKTSKGAIKKKMMKNQPEVTNQNKPGSQRKSNQISKEAAERSVNKPTNQRNSSFNRNTNPGPLSSCNIIGGRGIIHAGPSNPGRSNPGPPRSQNIIGGRGIVHSLQRQRPGPRDD